MENGQPIRVILQLLRPRPVGQTGGGLLTEAVRAKGL